MYSYFALVSRLKNIDRWALMRNADRENVQEHSHMVAVIAHALGLIRRDIFKMDCDPERAAAAALFHDAPEILTGDMPTPVKYHDENMIEAYRRIEDAAVDKLVSALPEELRGEYRELLKIPEDVSSLVHAADKLAAYIKCLEELKTGNGEFKSAADSTLLKLKKLKMPEVDYFIENFIPAFSLTLDELGL
ncbi:MAG: 5'-deoxynucleotidase [Oscillospiraceae bacterium]|nr:5'-deoxynucleotidase [Oscillospiraceae bacterium]MBQ5568075.1 5'-deoxynucleotidase [Oscillospiraceae bacterium]